MSLRCDGVDILVSFISMSGIRKLLDVLQRIIAAEGHTRSRILTATYTGATEARALDELARRPEEPCRGTEARCYVRGLVFLQTPSHEIKHRCDAIQALWGSPKQRKRFALDAQVLTTANEEAMIPAQAEIRPETSPDE